MRQTTTRRLVVLVFVAVGVMPAAGGRLHARAATAEGQPPAPQAPVPVIVAQGTGEVRAVPDVAYVALGVDQQAKTPKEAQAATAKIMTAIQQRLLESGVTKEAIRTTALDVQAQFDWVNGRQVPRGYLSRHHVEVRVDDVSRAGDVLDLAVGAGGTSVQGVRFDLKARTALEREALTKAVADGRARADAMAAGAGTSVVGVIRVEEGARYGGPEPVMMRMAAQADAAAPAPPVAPGETVIRATVTVTARVK